MATRGTVAFGAVGLLACAVSAETVVYDNSDLAFLLVPGRPTTSDPWDLTYPNEFDPQYSPSDNAAQNVGTSTFRMTVWRTYWTSSETLFDQMFRTDYSDGPSYGLALSSGWETTSSGGTIYHYQPAVQFGVGDVISASSFAGPMGDPVYEHAPFAHYGSENGLVRLLGDEAYVGFRIAEPGGVRYGFVRMTWFEDVEYVRRPPVWLGGPPTGTIFVDTYLPTAWGFETELDTPIEIVLAPTACSEGDVNSQGAGIGDWYYGKPDGRITGADIQFFVNAWLVGDLAIGDLTTTGAGSGDPGFGVPDGFVTGADINYYVNIWVAGCP